jgi:putative FmdB family regulatory protein
MPLYEFTCRECGAAFEDIVSLAELAAGDVRCPQCGSQKVERGFSTFSTGTSAGDAGPVCGQSSGSGCGFT